MIGFDIGGTKCAVCIGEEQDGSLNILKKEVIPTQKDISPYEMIEKMCILAEGMTDDFRYIGISCGGPLNSKRGIILSPPNLHGWDNVEISDFLKKRYGGEVYLQNDANACAVAEWKYGAGKGTSNMIFLTFGTGMGAGLILNGRLYSGSCDMAGEIGHVRLNSCGPVGYGKAGSFEGFCSGNGIAQLGRMFALEKFQHGENASYCQSTAELDKITAKTIAECADRGCRDALNVYEMCAEKLGFGLSVLIDILNPEVIVIGSIYQRAENLLAKKMFEVIDRESLQASRKICRILPAKLGESIGDYAALSVATLGKI